MREYPGDVTLVHLDGYRLEGAPAVSWLDTDLMFAPSKITLIEWAERFEGLLPPDHLAVRLEHVSANRRRLSLLPQGERARAIAERASAFQAPAAESTPQEDAQDVPRD
jgi:tRNA A37 threonylcarbamoyladenosine biosynthesis protein TsaE